MTALAQPTTQDLAAAYREFDRSRRVRHAKAGCILALILMPAGMTLDWFVYHSELIPILKARLLTDLGILPVFWLLFTNFGKRHIYWLGSLWALFCALAISWMVYHTEGVVSPYYAGLNLVILITCNLMPYTVIDALAVCGLTILMYTVAIIAHDAHHLPVREAFNNYYFLVLTAIIACTACGVFDRSRREDFRLRHQVDAQNQELNESYRKLAELDRLRSQFFANISHELRTPLTLILAPVEDLLRSGSRLPDAAASALGIARTNGLRLLKLINDLLEVVRIDAGSSTLHKERIELASFVNGVSESVRMLTDAQQLELEIQRAEGPLPVEADPARLEKILLNLLTNAIKFTPKGGRITVATARDGDRAAFSVTDTGVGIPEAALPYIFDRFRQVDGSSTRKYQGAGIGLALVKDLVAEHGGDIQARSTLGKGTSLTVRLPLAEKESARPTAAVPAAPAVAAEDPDALQEIYRTAERRGGITIADEQPVETIPAAGDPRAPLVLVVDDEPEMRRYLVSRLTERFQVIQSDHGQRAVELAIRAKPRLLLLDLMIPGIDGLSVCRRLRAVPDLALTKIILLTARADEDTKIEALKSGADDFLTKPFSTIEVLTRLDILLRTADLQLEMQNRALELEEALKRLKQTEAQLVQSEKMSALGTIAAGLLHEVNNPLNFTLSALQVALRSLPEQGELREVLEDIGTGMRRIKDIVTDLGMFAFKSNEKAQELVSFNQLLDSSLRLVAHELDGITVTRDVPSDCSFLGSKTQLSHVFLNLLVNSAKALRQVQDRERSISISARPEGGRLQVVVRDNGTGIKPEVLPRIFEPFFTTRGVGQGMGLGLSICHTIIANHGGTISARSEYGRWTEMTFDLPLALPRATGQEPQRKELVS